MPHQDAFKYLSKIRNFNFCIFPKYYLWSVNNQKKKILYWVDFFYDTSMWRSQKVTFDNFLLIFFWVLTQNRLYLISKYNLSNQTKHKCNIYIKIILKSISRDIFELKIILITLKKKQKNDLSKKREFWRLRKNEKHFITNDIIWKIEETYQRCNNG